MLVPMPDTVKKGISKAIKDKITPATVVSTFQKYGFKATQGDIDNWTRWGSNNSNMEKEVSGFAGAKKSKATGGGSNAPVETYPPALQRLLPVLSASFPQDTAIQKAEAASVPFVTEAKKKVMFPRSSGNMGVLGNRGKLLGN
jgi:hypothetical protein